MEAVVGIFATREDAEQAAGTLELAGIEPSRINVLIPGVSDEALNAVPTREAEAPGVGTALGAVTGAAAGAAGGMQLGAVATTVLIPGLGTVMALGVAGAVVLGALGAAVGKAFDQAPEGVPKDDVALYVEALRRGRSVVIVVADDNDTHELARAALRATGAESLHAARDRWAA